MIPRTGKECSTIFKTKVVEQRRPICRFELIKQNLNYKKSRGTKAHQQSHMMTCKIGLMKTKIKTPTKVCKTIPKGADRCAMTVKISKETREENVCTSYPSKIC